MKNILFCFFSLISLFTFSQQELTIRNTLDATFRPKSVQSVNWMNDGQYYSALENNKVIKYNVTTGKAVSTLMDGNEYNIEIENYEFSDNEMQLLLMTGKKSIYRRSFTAQYYIYTQTEGKLKALEGRLSYATFAPNGSKIAYVKENNLYYYDLFNDVEVQVTKDGKFNNIINGSSDWVYEEELYITKAFEWSGDSRKLAFLRFDETAVKEYNMQVWNEGALYPADYKFKYPKAGESNSKIDVFIHHLEEKKNVKVDIGSEPDIYIPRIYWTKDNDLLSIQRLNRLQNQLDVLHADAASGATTLIVNERSKTYIDFTFCDDLLYLDNGKQFIMSSEKDGYKHFYLYDMSGQLIRQITRGLFEATDKVGIDQKAKTPVLYYLSTEVSPLERHLYSIDINGNNKKKLTLEAGISDVNMSPDTQFYMNYHSSASKPLSITLYKTLGNKKLTVLQDNAALVETVKQYQLSPKEFFVLRTFEGYDLNGYMIKPVSFDSTKQYPVLMFQYSGPGSQQVANSWAGGNFYWHQLLTQKGYIVVVLDPRGTGYRGAEFKKGTYKELGKLEVEDVIKAAVWLGKKNYIDEARIGIWGWSYGGYMSSLALMKGADVFKAAIAVAPVTTWRFYDTIYTERYLQRPQDNPTGYDDNSPIQHVSKLTGNFLLIHGTGDDNVHFQNSVALQNELIKANKQFQSFYYPDLAHGLGYRDHLYEMMTRFILNNL